MAMESAGMSDVDVLDDLLHDVDGDNFEDAEAFFDADPDDEGSEGLNTDNILSQLDAVTTLDDNAQNENTSEMQDSTSTPSSPQVLRPDESTMSPDNAAEEKTELGSHVLEQLSPLSGEAVVQAVLDLAANADSENDEVLQTKQNESSLPTQEFTSLQHNSAEEVPNGEVEVELRADIETKTDDEGDSVVDEVLDAVVVSTPINISSDYVDDVGAPIETKDMPSTPPVREVMSEMEAPSDSIIVPPPAPVAVIIGSMNPVEYGNDDSDDSQGEDGENMHLAPPLQLTHSDDDDEDILEVDAAVVSSLQIEEKQRLSKRNLPAEPLASKNADFDGDNALLNALPKDKADGTGTIDLSFGEEIRVAHITTLEPSSPFSDIHKIAGGANADVTFGISYQSMRKKSDEPHTDEDGTNYSLPTGPAFPDEREFENDMRLTSDLSFSVAETNVAPDNAEDDEFTFDVKPDGYRKVLSEDEIKARRESLEVQKRKEEEKLVKELKRATDEEKKLIETSKIMESTKSDMKMVDEEAADPDAMSLTELHGIYKRGLGDQEVLMDDEEEKETLKKAEGNRAPEASRSMSVMGRIFSQTQGTTETIAEEADEEDGEGGTNADNKGDFQNGTTVDDNTTNVKTGKSNVDESAEWREIKLVQHRENSPSETTAKFTNGPETPSISYAEAAGYYAETPDVMQHRDVIVPEDFPRGSCMKCFSRPRLTFTGAIEERDRVFCIAATAFDAHNAIVVGMLQTIYRKIMKSSRDVLLIGRHWEDVGFQGSDPSTDLRGCGVLSLLQILYLVESYPDLAHRLHALSQHPTRHFPFACMLINITLQCVVALRSGALYLECNKHTSVLTGMNRLHIALTSQLHDAFQSRSDEIPIIMKDVLDRSQSNPSKVIDEVFDGTALRPPRPIPSTGTSNSKISERKQSDKNLEFSEIGLHSVDGEE